jgi:hypothetical protein
MPICLAFVLLLTLTLPAGAELPWFTEEAETLDRNTFTFDLGLAYRKEPRDFGVPPRRESQWDLAQFRFSMGLGPAAELQVSGVPLTRIELEDQSFLEPGDFVLGTKLRLLGEKNRRPALGLLWEVKLPAASDEEGGATDETDFFGFFLLSRSVAERHRLHFNLGVGILGDPDKNAAQNDVAIVRLAWESRFGDGKSCGLEALVQGGPQDDDDTRLVRAIYSQRVGKVEIYGGFGVGIGEDSDDFRVDLGLRRAFRLRGGG